MSDTVNTIAPVAYLLIGLAFVLGLGVALFLVRRSKAQMSDHFRSLATQVLENNSKTFVQIAKGELEKTQVAAEGDLAQRQHAIKSLVDPLKEQLEKYQQRLQQNETAIQRDPSIRPDPAFPRPEISRPAQTDGCGNRRSLAATRASASSDWGREDWRVRA